MPGVHDGAVKQTIKYGDGDDIPTLAAAVVCAMLREPGRTDRDDAR